MKFTIPGRPVGKERPRTARGHTYTPQRTQLYEALVIVSLRKTTPRVEALLQGPLEVTIVWSKQVTKSWSKKRKAEALAGVYAVGMPDVDNVAKSITDALNGVAYDDDSQVAVLHVSRVYVEQEDSVTVEITQLGA